MSNNLYDNTYNTVKKNNNTAKTNTMKTNNTASSHPNQY